LLMNGHFMLNTKNFQKTNHQEPGGKWPKYHLNLC
jgi:hypothetical protein